MVPCSAARSNTQLLIASGLGLRWQVLEHHADKRRMRTLCESSVYYATDNFC
jgi:hypothetical protein